MNAKTGQYVNEMQNVSTQLGAIAVTVNLATGSPQQAVAQVSIPKFMYTMVYIVTEKQP